jgi:hypothetical protein
VTAEAWKKNPVESQRLFLMAEQHGYRAPPIFEAIDTAALNTKSQKSAGSCTGATLLLQSLYLMSFIASRVP